MQDQFLMRFHLFPRLPHDAALPWECIEKVYASFSQLWNNRQQQQKGAINTEQLVADRDNLLLNRAATTRRAFAFFALSFRSSTSRRPNEAALVTAASRVRPIIFLNLTLDDVRVVLQEEVVEVFWNEGGHTRVCQCCEEHRDLKQHPPTKTNKKKETKPSTTSSNLWLLTLIVKIQVKKRSTEWIQT